MAIDIATVNFEDTKLIKYVLHLSTRLIFDFNIEIF